MKALKTVVGLLKMGWVGIFTSVFIGLIFIKRIAGGKKAYAAIGRWTLTNWTRWALHTLGVRYTLHGTLPSEGALIVANHITYVDPIILLAATPSTMLAKVEVKKYPLIGFGATSAGILYVKRDAEGSRVAASKAIEAGLRDGRVVGLFPEGTTSPDGEVYPFKPGSFKAAALVGAPVVPVAITYRQRHLAWLGTEQLLPHFIRCHALGKVHADVWVGPTLQSTDTEELRSACEAWIREKVIAIKKQS